MATWSCSCLARRRGGLGEATAVGAGAAASPRRRPAGVRGRLRERSRPGREGVAAAGSAIGEDPAAAGRRCWPAAAGPAVDEELAGW
eukprot:2820450-Alexandrium_andersonii.AAC.1